jgi:hypothetical protein
MDLKCLGAGRLICDKLAWTRSSRISHRSEPAGSLALPAGLRVSGGWRSRWAVGVQVATFISSLSSSGSP